MSIQSNELQHISVLVSAGQNPISGEPRHHRNDSLALAMGQHLAHTNAIELQVLHAGNADNPALLDYLALGADKIQVVSAEPDANIVDALAEHLEHVDLILTGSQAESGQQSGLLPYLLATKLKIPIVANALEIKQAENRLEILQFLPKGKRRQVSVTLPAIIAIHPLASVDLLYVYARQQVSKIVSINKSLKKSDALPDSKMQSQLNPKRKINKLKANENLNGHERLMLAINSKTKGGTVVNEGNSVEKAQVILNYLREHQLITF